MLHKSIREVRRLGSHELAAWQAYFDLEWAPDHLNNWHFAMLAFVAARVAGDKRAKLSSYMPPEKTDYTRGKSKGVQSQEEQIRIMKTAFRSATPGSGNDNG